ncbi:MAG: hypothetical protein AAGC55_00245 [Myxococcota bacterium]
MLSSLFLSSRIEAIGRVLSSLTVDQRLIAVLDQPALGRPLGGLGYRVLSVADSAKALRRSGDQRLCGRANALPLADSQLAALVARGIGQRDDWSAVLCEWRRVVDDGGAIILLDRAPATELTRRALCGGLTEIVQSQAGRTIVTSGRVMKL